MEENRIIEENQVPAALSAEECVEDETSITDMDGEGEVDDRKPTEREEYEALIKNRFKDFYAEDTQRLINRRFRKYKVMEERFRLLEEALAAKEAELGESAERLAGFEAHLRSELERVERETEERVIGEIRARSRRPFENGVSPSKCGAPVDVSRLTKSERATLAVRAARGEKIKF